MKNITIKIVCLVMLITSFTSVSLAADRQQSEQIKCIYNGRRYNPGTIITDKNGKQLKCQENGKWKKIN